MRFVASPYGGARPGAASGRHVEAGAALAEVRASVPSRCRRRAPSGTRPRQTWLLEFGGRPGIGRSEADVEVAEAAFNEARAQEVYGPGRAGRCGRLGAQTASLAVAVAEAQVAAVGIGEPPSTSPTARSRGRPRLRCGRGLDGAGRRRAATTLRSPIAGKASRPGGSVLVTVKDLGGPGPGGRTRGPALASSPAPPRTSGPPRAAMQCQHRCSVGETAVAGLGFRRSTSPGWRTSPFGSTGISASRLEVVGERGAG